MYDGRPRSLVPRGANARWALLHRSMPPRGPTPTLPKVSNRLFTPWTLVENPRCDCRYSLHPNHDSNPNQILQYVPPKVIRWARKNNISEGSAHNTLTSALLYFVGDSTAAWAKALLPLMK